MKILFKDDGYYYYLDNSNILRISEDNGTDLTNVTHLDDVEVLYHYRNSDGDLLPVYFEQGIKFVSADPIFEYNLLQIDDSFTKDNTLVNIKLLDDI